jgi:hypothetical protein
MRFKDEEFGLGVRPENQASRQQLFDALVGRGREP